MKIEATKMPQFLRELLANPPRHGEGVHQWLFKVARHLHAHYKPDEICKLLAAAVEDCGRDVPESEIRQAVDNSRACAWSPKGNTAGGPWKSSATTGVVRAAKPTPKWPERDRQAIAGIAAADPGALALLQSSSPVKVHPSKYPVDRLLEQLFPGDPLLCMGRELWDVDTGSRIWFKDHARSCCLLVPSPMKAPSGIKKDGQCSNRCLDNTGPRHYLVTEFDEGDRDQQSAIIRHLAVRAPLVMVVDSAGKSLHAWWYCEGCDESKVRRFFCYAVSLGADPATWSCCQLVRMPLGPRQRTRKCQLVHYFDPDNTPLTSPTFNPSIDTHV